MTKCPGCGGALEGLATFCHSCGRYVADIGAPEADPARDSRSRIPDDRLEDVIQRETKTCLQLLGFEVFDFSQDRPTRQTAGIADLYVCGHGRCTWAEMKRADGIQSSDQITFEEVVTENGAEYHVWRHESDAIAWAKGVIEAGTP